MREIKFRAWGNGEMEYMPEVVDGPDSPNERLGCFLCDNFGCEITQYTGLKDKNGKEIYEGDIINTLGSGPCVVLWSNESLCWMYEWSECISGSGCYLYIENDHHKIIGNIYENPELLEK